MIIHVGTNNLRSSQDLVAIAKNIPDIAKINTTNKNEILVSSIVPPRDNLNGKGRQVITLYKNSVWKLILSM